MLCLCCSIVCSPVTIFPINCFVTFVLDVLFLIWSLKSLLNLLIFSGKSTSSTSVTFNIYNPTISCLFLLRFQLLGLCSHRLFRVYNTLSQFTYKNFVISVRTRWRPDFPTSLRLSKSKPVMARTNNVACISYLCIFSSMCNLHFNFNIWQTIRRNSPQVGTDILKRVVWKEKRINHPSYHNMVKLITYY